MRFAIPFSRLRRLATLHADQRGAVSIVTVFALLMFTMLLVMMVNAGTHLDDKIRMQNAADAAAYSGGVVLARGMNAVAFSNHLLCDVFAITAYLREARDRDAEKFAPEILAAWQRTGQIFATAEFEKFRRLGEAILDKVPKEQELVTSFGELNARSAEFALPVFEYILRGNGQSAVPGGGQGGGGIVGAGSGGGQSADGLIPTFQRELIRSIPQLAQQTTNEIARRHGLPRGDSSASAPGDDPRGPMAGVLWRMDVMPVGSGDENDPTLRTLPLVDPNPSQSDFAAVPSGLGMAYFDDAVSLRRTFARRYLDDWNDDKLVMFDREARMSQFGTLWRIFTCEHLRILLEEEYPDRNLPMMLRRTEEGVNVEQALLAWEQASSLSRTASSPQEEERNRLALSAMLQAGGNVIPAVDLDRYLGRNFAFVAVAYRKPLSDMGAKLFRNPLGARADAQTFAQVELFVPARRWWLGGGGDPAPARIGIGGSPGYGGGIELPAQGGGSDPGWGGEGWPMRWDSFNQNWTVQLTPAIAEPIVAILQTDPGDACDCGPFRLPGLRDATIEDIRRVTTH